MNDTQIKTLEQVRQFLEGTADVELCTDSKKDRYAWIQTTLVRFRYLQLSKANKGMLLTFLQKGQWLFTHPGQAPGKAVLQDWTHPASSTHDPRISPQIHR